MARALWIRTTDAKDVVDTFLICTITTIVVVRLFLVITGYPQLGGSGLHIAHLLWGGLLMLIALVLTMTLLTRAARWTAAVLGGIGFGLFIDEIGKFVTADNDYFYRPAYSIMYVFLVVFWLLTRRLFVSKSLTPREAIANALDWVKESAIRDLNEDERHKALGLLERFDLDDPVAREVRSVLEHLDTVPTPPPRRVKVFFERLRNWYFSLTARSWFPAALIAVFVVLTLVNVAHVVELAVKAIDAAGASGATLDSVDDAVNGKRLGFSGWATMGSSLVVIVLNTIGIVVLPRAGRLAAYRWFERGLLVDIFLVQVFNFADLQLAAFGILVASILLLITLRLMMSAEERPTVRSEVAHGVPAPA